MIGPFTKTEGVQARLGGISREAVASKAARRQLLRVTTADHVHLYPVWQFTDGDVLNGLSRVLSLFRDAPLDNWTLAAWLRSVEPELGETPHEALLRGNVDGVLAVARAAARNLAV